MTTEQFNESVNAEIRRMTNKAKPYPAGDCQFDCNNFLICNRCGLPMEDHDPSPKQLTWPTIEEQQEYWRVRDIDLDRIESATQFYDERAFDSEDAEEWQRRSEREGLNPNEF